MPYAGRSLARSSVPSRSTPSVHSIWLDAGVRTVADAAEIHRSRVAQVIIGSETLASLEEARAVIAATSEDLLNLEIALLVRELNPTQRVVLHLTDPHLAQMLREAAESAGKSAGAD